MLARPALPEVVEVLERLAATAQLSTVDGGR
jgi:hypothetical protein